MTREEAYEELTQRVKSINLIRHSLACESIMMEICKRLNPTADEVTLNTWGITGLLHDGDYEITRETPGKHGILLAEELENRLNDEITHAIKSHNYLRNGIIPESKLDWAIYCCDELSGIIVAGALVHPDKKLEPVDLDFIMKRFNDPSFARSANREQIKMCEQNLGIPFPEFIEIALNAMKKISKELNL